MPDDRAAGPGPRGDGAPRPRRRRSIDNQGGIDVADLVAQHTGIRPKFDVGSDAATDGAHGMMLAIYNAEYAYYKYIKLMFLQSPPRRPEFPA